MLNIKYTDFLNEEMAVISSRKLRDAMHDIIVGLEPKKTMDVEEMSGVLMNDYKITISPFFLDKFLDDFMKAKRGDRKVKTFFTKADARWLGVRDNKGTKEMRNNLLYLKPNLAKHKKKLFEDEDRKKLDDAYKAGMKDLSFSEDVIKNSLILQKPEDSEDIMKLIYNDIIFQNRYENTYDNCWKLAMLIGKQNKLDRVTGWFKLAPQSVKDAYYKGKEGERQINYDLTKPSKSVVKKPVANKPSSVEKSIDNQKSSIDVVKARINKYKNWGEFIKDFTLRDLIEMVELLDTEVMFDTEGSMDEFLAKIDQLNYILNTFYKVDRRDIIMFYKNVGLATFLRNWESTNKKPKINEF